ncbi:MAG: SpoIID/LytB domain-containing protein [Chloroflexi bacterium]|nr:SpoIID/LytB domain-containing protein [Chloroflexota bacterium]
MEIRATDPTPIAAGSLRSRWITALLVAVMLVLMGVVPIAAASVSAAPACSGANLRIAASTSATAKVSLGVSTSLTISGTVTGSSWGTNCPSWKSGSSWYSITQVNGRSVSSLYGVPVLYVATGVVNASSTPVVATTPAPAAVPAATAIVPASISIATPTSVLAATTPIAVPSAGLLYVPACSGAKLRTGTSTRTTLKASVGPPNFLTVSGTLRGSSWSTLCPTRKSGSTWYRVTHVNGRPVASLYGVSAVYAASGILAASTSTAPVPTTPPTDTSATDPTPDPASTILPATPPTPTPTPTPTPASPPPSASPPPTAATPTPPSAPSPGSVATADGPGTVLVPACGAVNLRTGTTTGASIKVKLGYNDTVNVTGTVSGQSWSASCPTPTAGSDWYVISQVNGQSVLTQYGVAALYAASGVLTQPTSASSTGVTALGTSTVFYGRGYGHGVGLSQYGARGRALAGQTAAAILAQYYAGTTIGTISTDTLIRVLLLDNFTPSAAAPLTIYGRGGPWTITGVNVEFPAEAKLSVLPPTAGTGWRAIVLSTPGGVLFDGPATGDFQVVPLADTTTIQLFSKPATNDLFRGSLRVLITGASIDVINILPIESYLRGVVPAEMPTSWPVEARIAQTIAARAYAAFHLVSGGTFDVYDDTRSQVYVGVRREHPDADAVVTATAGQVVMSGSSVANAMFHSTAGGWTENNENVFVSSTGAKTAAVVSYLRGSSDRDSSGVSYDAGAPYATWQTNAYSAAQLSAFFGSDPRTNVGSLTALDLRNRGVSGRLISVTLIGSAGTKTVSGSVFVAVFNAYRPSADPILRGTLLDVAPIP